MKKKSLDSEIRHLEARKQKLLRLKNLRREVSRLEESKFVGTKKIRSIKKVASEVCGRFGLKLGFLFRGERTNEITIPRHIVFYISREIVNITFQELADLFHQNHATIIYGCVAVKNRMSVDSRYASTVNELVDSCRKKLDDEKSFQN